MGALEDILAAIPDLQALILDAGETADLIQPGPLRNPARPAEGHLPGTPNTVPVAVIDYEASEIDGKTIRRGDRLVIMLAADLGGLVPTTSDQVEIDGNAGRIINAAQIRAGGNPVAFELQVRA